MPFSFRPASRSRGRAALGGCLLWAAGLLSSPVNPAGQEEYAVVVSPDVPVSNLSMDQLHRLFLFRERYWKPGLAVTVLLSEDGLEPGSFLLEKIYRMDYASLRRLILEKLYQAEIDLAPKVVASDEVAVAFVASGRGLVAFVRANAAHGSSVKVVSIDGVPPGAPGYVLRR